MHKDIEVIAVFKANGDIKPIYVQLEEGNEKHLLKVDYYTSADKRYAGVSSVEFECKLEDETEMVLIYFLNKHQWKIKNAPTC